jgi:histidyl-tRNA synthetase
MSKYSIPRGTQDFITLNAQKKQYTSLVLKSVSEFFGFRPIETPIFESTELFSRSVGEGSDVVNKEMYTFNDRGDRSITLRPEWTAGVIRAVVENKLTATEDLPIKLFYDGPVFRYERPQKGRYRQLHQFGVEAVGINSALEEAEVLLLAAHSLNELGITKFKFYVNTLGDINSRTKYVGALKEHFGKHIHEMCDDCKVRIEKNPLRILDCKVDNTKTFFMQAPQIINFLSPEAKAHFLKILDQLERYDVKFEWSPNLVRGLDYYSGLVYEIYVETKEPLGAVGGGGTYNHLVSEIGGPEMQATGYSFGIERLIMVMEEQELFKMIKNQIFAFVMPLETECLQYAFEIAMFLRFNQIKSEVDVGLHSMKAQFKIADRKGAKYLIIVGKDELTKQTVKVKNNLTQEQVEMPANQLLNHFMTIIIDEYRSEQMALQAKQKNAGKEMPEAEIAPSNEGKE